MDPNVCSKLQSLFILWLQRTVQLRIERITHKETSEVPVELATKASLTTLHKSPDESRRDGVQLVLSESPITVCQNSLIQTTGRDGPTLTPK